MPTFHVLPEAGPDFDSSLPQGVFSTFSDSVLVLDPQGRYLWVSQGAAELLGHDPLEMTGHHWREFPGNPLLRGLDDPAWQRHSDRREPIREALAHPGREGLRHLEVSLSPVRRQDGTLLAWVVLGKDITHRVAMEDTLRRTEDQLRHAQKVDALGRLAGGIAHDFNNLMTVVNGYSDLLLQYFPADAAKEDPGQESGRALVQEIRKAGQKAAMLTHQLLAFSRKQAASLPRPLELNQVILDMEKMLRRSLGGHFELLTELDAELPPTLGDPGQVGQILMNLILNARDAMPKGGRIRIRTATVQLTGREDHLMLAPLPGSYCLLTVEDTGVGIGPELRGRLFEPFFSTKEKGKGTGLGLSTVFGIVKDLGGGIGLVSEPRIGSAFTVYLPRGETALPIAPGAPEPAGARAARGGATILLVEDEDPVRRLLANILAGQGYRVIEAVNGAQAIQVFSARGEGIDLVLTDLIMPGMSGREMMQALHAVRAGLKVIFMSGYIDDDAMVEGLGEGQIPFLAKPFSPSELGAKVREVLLAREA